MITLKSKGLFASLALSVLFMVGSAATAHANETDKEKEKKNQPKVEAKTLAPQWYVFNGNPNDPSQLEDPSFYAPYTPTMTNPEPACEDGTNLCAVKAEPNSSNTSIPDETNLLDILERNQGSSPDRSEIKHQP
ncbi:hypothetical protein [Sphingobacterium pedocola]|uniref:Secreted protein n=1 Tax=Sphingobacterium pedocola TaxID=2082722 RepID=A0ABR9T9C3_9SPHI|nr:hypothetical protein [Sphingobacterium pedocola]MBE8721918.1 hypothetical protein [Sphingobacterium pedocola]